MKLKRSYIEELIQKKMFIDELNKAICGHIGGVQNVSLDVFLDERDNLHEYLVVKYNGGAMSVRNCSINSNYANYTELGKMLISSYSAELQQYMKLKEGTCTDISELLFDSKEV